MTVRRLEERRPCGQSKPGDVGEGEGGESSKKTVRAEYLIDVVSKGGWE